MTARITENPFLVLGLAPGASRQQVEREAQKLLGMLELGLAAATTYATPLGPRPRTPELVRAAVATLRDPAKRLAAEVWTAPGVSGVSEMGDTPVADAFDDALVKLGWRA